MTARRIYQHLRDLLDVAVSSPADGQVLTYDVATSKWKNQAAGGGSLPVAAGVSGNVGDVVGVVYQTPGVFVVGGIDKDTPLNGNGAVLTDAFAQWNGNGAALRWVGNGTDGQQTLAVTTDAGQTLLHDAAGNLSPAGTVVDLPDPTNAQDAATKNYVDIAGGIVTHAATDAIVAQGSGTVGKVAAASDYLWQRAGDAVTVSFGVRLDATTAGQAGQPIFVSLPALPVTADIGPVAIAGPACGVVHAQVGGVGVWGFIEATTIGGNLVRLAFDKTNTTLIGAAETLAPDDSLKGTFTYFTA